MPTSFFWSAATLRKSAISSLMAPFLLRYLMRRASSSSALAAFSASTSSRSWLILAIIFLVYYYIQIKRCKDSGFYHNLLLLLGIVFVSM